MFVTDLKFDPKKGYSFGEPTFYSSKHLGIDLVSNKTPLKFPVDLFKCTYTKGEEGGLTVTGEDGLGYIHRFMHNSEFKTSGATIPAGTIFAISGNTGKLSKGDHVHWDTRKPGTARSNLAFVNFVDPTKDWMVNVLPKLLPQPPESTETALSDWEVSIIELAKTTGVMTNMEHAKKVVTEMKEKPEKFIAWLLEMNRKSKNSEKFR